MIYDPRIVHSIPGPRSFEMPSRQAGFHWNWKNSKTQTIRAPIAEN
jgi:hypothetical protein